jgi:NAD-reducing hydrogenase small subunit
MSVLDLDEKLVELAPAIEIVYGPLVDAKVYPENVDVALIEGAVAAEEHQHLLREIRARTKILIALGDCAVTSNVPGMRNQVGKEAALKRAYFELAAAQPQIPGQVVTPLVKTVHPLHAEVPIDIFVPGCPPSADRIYYVLAELLAGRMPKLQGKQLTFG